MITPLPVLNGADTAGDNAADRGAKDFPARERAHSETIPVTHEEAIRLQPGAALPREGGGAADTDVPAQMNFGGSASTKDWAWVRRQFSHAAWTAQALRKWGKPENFYHYSGGIGDEVLMTAVFRELRKRGQGPVVMMTPYPQLFQNNPDVKQLLPEDPRLVQLAKLFRKKAIYPCYTYENIREQDCLYGPPYPIIARMCELCNIDGPVDLRPYVYLTDEEKRDGQVARRQVAIMSSGLSAMFKQRNKQWAPECYQAVVDALGDRFDFVQLGRPEDPALAGALDLRGKTSLRQSAAVLSQSLAFVGNIGLLMHLARAVDCRSVIIYGGRETPYQSGYGANENLYMPLPCSPCWKSNTCPYDRECLRRITPEMVVEALLRQGERHGEPLPVDRYRVVVDHGETPEGTFARGVLPDIPA